MPTLSLSKEDMELNSALATHDALIELGRHKAMADIEVATKDNKKKQLFQIINNFSKDIKTVKVTKKHGNSWDTTVELYYNAEKIDSYVATVMEYMNLLHENIKQNEETLEKLNEENRELKEELAESHCDYSALEDKIDKQDEYWKNRVAKLREKCIRKNKYIKILNWGFIFIITQILLANQIGIFNYMNMLYVCVDFCGYCICLICRYIFSYCYIFGLLIPILYLNYENKNQFK